MWPNWVDLVVLAFAFRGCYVGFSRGGVVECLYLGGLVGATAVSGSAAGGVIQWCSPWWRGDPRTLNLLGSAGVFLLLVVAVSLVIRHVAVWLTRERIPWWLQALGLLTGGARGLWWAGVFLLFLLATGQPYLVRSITERSLSAAHVMEVSAKSIGWMADRLPGPATGLERSIFLLHKKGSR